MYRGTVSTDMSYLRGKIKTDQGKKPPNTTTLAILRNSQPFKTDRDMGSAVE